MRRFPADHPEEEMVDPAICEVCRRDFQPKGRRSKVCSAACAGEAGASARNYRKAALASRPTNLARARRQRS